MLTIVIRRGTRRPIAGMWLRAACILSIALSSCSRAHYRRSADQETYGIIAEKMDKPAWAIPHTDISPPEESRLHDPSDPDCPPMPLDDRSAHRFMHCADGLKGYRDWHDNGYVRTVEDARWHDFLQLSKDGTL